MSCSLDVAAQMIGITITVLAALMEVVTWARRKPNDAPASPLQYIVATLSYLSIHCGGRPIVFLPEANFRAMLKRKWKLNMESPMSVSRQTTLRESRGVRPGGVTLLQHMFEPEHVPS